MNSTSRKKISRNSLLARAVAGLALLSLGFAAAGLTPTTSPASAPATRPHTMPALPTVNVDVAEWVVFITDANAKELSPRDEFDNSLPSFVNDSRREPTPSPASSTAPATQPVTLPGPIGMIRISPRGKINTDVAFDVELTYKNGRVLGHWPPAKSRPASILWQDVHFAAPAEKPRALPESSWLADARAAADPAQMLTCGSVTEPFLLYDFALNYNLVLQVSGGENGHYQIASGMTAPLQNITLYKRDPASAKWRTATLETLNKSEPKAPATTSTRPASSTKPATAKAPPPPPPTSMRFRRPPAGVADSPAAPTIPLAGTDLTLGPADATQETVLAPWRARLAAAGISSADQQIILKILAKYALDPKRLTAIYCMDPAEFDKILPLEVLPQPKKVSRIALVVVTGIDPAMGDELSQWITQLGDKSWEKREAAMAEIQKLGSRAKQQLEKAAHDKDLEVVYRAEQLLQLIAAENPAKPDPNQ